MKLKSLGIGSNNFDRLSTVAFLLETNDERCLIDCGPDTPKRLKALGCSFLDVDAIIITHKHFDHVLGLPYFIFGRGVEALGKKRADANFANPKLTIFCSNEIRSFVEYSMNMAQGGFNWEAENVHFVTLDESGCKHQIIGWEFQFVPVDHTVPTLGFVLSNQEEKLLCYTADMVKGTNLAVEAVGSKFVVCECMVTDNFAAFINKALHAGVSDAAKFIKTVGPQEAFLVHIRPDLAAKSDEMQSSVSEMSGIRSRYLVEGEVIDLS